MPATDAIAFESPRGVPAWIEDAEGTIVRGVAESVTADGARIRLATDPGFGQGADVSLRLSLDLDSPTVAVAACVSWVRSERGEVECGLEWTGAHASLDEWLASRG